MKKALAILLLTAVSMFDDGSVIHVVTIKWKTGTTAAQIKTAVDGPKVSDAEHFPP